MRAPVAPHKVRPLLERHILADGLPLVVDLETSHGPWLVDEASGREYLDFFSSFSTCPLGFNHPAMREELFAAELLTAAVNKVSNSDLYTGALARFVGAFVTTLPAGLRDHLFFIEGGAPAVENALKTAFDWKKRRNLQEGKSAEGAQILHFRQAFHGRTGYTLSLTNTDPRKTDYFPKFDWPRVTNPKLSFPPTESGLAATIEAEKQAVAEIEQAVAERRDDIAALIIEPIQGEGGDNHFRPEFLVRLRELANEHEFLLIFDEVQTGFGTTGTWWCFEHFGIEPDLLVFGKKTQVCGIAAGNRIDSVDSVFAVSSRINSTWGGNLTDMVRCRRIIEIIAREGLIRNAATCGALLLKGLQELEGRFPDLVSSSRGRGMFLAFDLPDGESRAAALEGLHEEGLLALASGERSVRFRPPISLTDDEARDGLRRCEIAIGRLRRQGTPG